jgi:hypothetical protein
MQDYGSWKRAPGLSDGLRVAVAADYSAVARELLKNEPRVAAAAHRAVKVDSIRIRDHQVHDLSGQNWNMKRVGGGVVGRGRSRENGLRISDGRIGRVHSIAAKTNNPH